MSSKHQKRQLVLGIDASRANVSARTGIEWYAYHVIQGLKGLVPSDVQVVLYSREALQDGLEELPANWESRVLRWPWLMWTQLRLSWEMLRRPPDVLFTPAHTLPVVLPRRSIVTLHDVAFFAVPDAYSLAGRLYHKFASWFAVHFASRLLTVSEFSRGEIVRYLGAHESDIAVAPNSYDERVFRAGLAVEGGEPYFLYIGRLDRKKNLSMLLSAFAEYARAGGQARLKLVGKRGRGGEDVMENMPAEIREHVDELGYVASDDLPALYAGALAFVFPSRYEGFGIPLLEAFACGTAVISTNATAIPEVVGEAAILVGTEDVVGLAEAMRRIETDEVLRDELIKAGFARVKHYSWARTAELVWKELASLLDKAR